jgi:hypothetical protein
MKITMLMVFLLVVSATMFGQYGNSVNMQAQPIYMADHSAHASQGDMRVEANLLGSNSVTTAQGERPLWEFPDNKYVKPLGDVAREYRKEHATAVKATRIWNQ